MIEKDFVPKPYTNTVESGTVSWASPSNIALVKYWGKKAHQIPENTSISFTLNHCKTETKISFKKKAATNDFSFDVFLEGEKEDDFKPKIETFFKRIETYLPFLKHYYFKIETSNTFPHSSGIASSASGMSALALCLLSIEKQLGADLSEENFTKKASFLARLGSGSACRSLEGPIVVWGAHHEIKGSSNLYGVTYTGAVHESFKNYRDTILLIDKGEKQVSSTVGHNLMFNHPFAQERFKQAETNITALKHILEQGDLDEFIALVEREALTLHAMMMTSMPYFILMKPNTLEVIHKIWEYRKATNSKVCFTLDAGANVHMLYPDSEAQNVLKFIETELAGYCQNKHYINDSVGLGASAL